MDIHNFLDLVDKKLGSDRKGFLNHEFNPNVIGALNQDLHFYIVDLISNTSTKKKVNFVLDHDVASLSDMARISGEPVNIIKHYKQDRKWTPFKNLERCFKFFDNLGNIYDYYQAKRYGLSYWKQGMPVEAIRADYIK